ncbi:MAG: hypothetical protein ACTSYS_16410, partial [Promethearchaeota archaeon]
KNQDPESSSPDHFHDDTVDYKGFSDEQEIRLPVVTMAPNMLWIPIVTCIAMSGLLSFLLNIAGVPISYGFDEEEYGFSAALVNALIFIAVGGVSAFILIKLVKKKGINVLEKIMMGAFLFLGIFIIYFYGSYVFGMFEMLYPMGDFWYYLLLITSVLLGLFLLYFYASKKFSEKVRNIAVIIYGVLIGSFLPLIIPTWTSVLILIGFSLYDIYSVKKGPINEMMNHIAGDDFYKSGEPATIDVSNISIDIGIGDLAFYSMLTSLTLISDEFGGPLLVSITGNPAALIFPFIFTIAGILIGAFITFEFVKKSKILPGLPFSIFIGIGFCFLSILIGILIF